MIETVFRKQRTKEIVNGYTNRCMDGKYVVFLDYDDFQFEWIQYEIEALQTLFHLGDFYIFESSPNSYHAVCFDKVSVHEYISILRNSSVDTNYINVPLHFGKKVWTLRLTDKDKQPIKYIKRFTAYRDTWRDQSSAHIDLIESLFKEVIVNEQNPDLQEKLVLSRYPL